MRRSSGYQDPLFKGMRIGDTTTRRDYGLVFRNIPVMFYCLFLSAAVLFICSRSSPWYPFNNWDDANSYFTVGKSIWKGLVPYRDLFDQKGYILYFLYAIAYLIDNTGFTGVFIMEIIAVAFFLLAQYMIITLYADYRAAVVMLPFICALTCSARCFYWGGSAEEFMLPFLSFGLYALMSYTRRGFPRMMTKRTVLAGGILAGAVLNIKFNSLGLFIAFFLIMTVTTIISKKGGYTLAGRIVNALQRMVVFAAGMLVSTLPGLIYFGYHRALDSWFKVYLYLNIFVYGKKLTFSERILRMLDIMKEQYLSNRPIFTVVALGMAAGVLYLILCAVKRDVNPFNKDDVTDNVILEIISFIFSGALLFAGIFAGGVTLAYYPLPLTIFAAGFAIFAGRLMELVFKRTEVYVVLFVAAFIGAVAISYSGSMNVPYHYTDSKELWVFRFRDRIKQSGIEDPTLINVNCFDAGLYTVCDITPNCRFFQTQTIDIDDVRTEQSAYIREGRGDFMLSRDIEEERVGDNYEIIDVISQDLAGFDHTYYLYQKTEKEE